MCTQHYKAATLSFLRLSATEWEHRKIAFYRRRVYSRRQISYRTHRRASHSRARFLFNQRTHSVINHPCDADTSNTNMKYIYIYMYIYIYIYIHALRTFASHCFLSFFFLPPSPRLSEKYTLLASVSRKRERTSLT